MADDGVLIGVAEHPQVLRYDRANRHGLVAGATGTGKTVTLQVLAQGFSDAGVPVFAADVKGDLSGIAAAAQPDAKLQARAQAMGIALQPRAAPVIFWDLFGQEGHPIRATVSEMGPLLLARMLDLNDVQEGVLNVAFRVADEQVWCAVAVDVGCRHGNRRRARCEVHRIAKLPIAQPQFDFRFPSAEESLIQYPVTVKIGECLARQRHARIHDQQGGREGARAII